MSHVTKSVLLPTRYVSDSYTILIAVFALPTDPDLRRLKFQPMNFEVPRDWYVSYQYITS